MSVGVSPPPAPHPVQTVIFCHLTHNTSPRHPVIPHPAPSNPVTRAVIFERHKLLNHITPPSPSPQFKSPLVVLYCVRNRPNPSQWPGPASLQPLTTPTPWTGPCSSLPVNHHPSCHSQLKGSQARRHGPLAHVDLSSGARGLAQLGCARWPSSRMPAGGPQCHLAQAVGGRALPPVFQGPPGRFQ